RNLRSLHVGGCWLAQQHIRELAHAVTASAKLPRLASINLSDNRLDHVALRSMADMLTFRELRVDTFAPLTALDLSGNHLRNSSENSALTDIARQPSLRALNLAYNVLGASVLSIVQTALARNVAAADRQEFCCPMTLIVAANQIPSDVYFSIREMESRL